MTCAAGRSKGPYAGRVNPDVAAAVERLRGEGVLEDLPANLFGRVARRELVTVRLEIRAALYLGVLLLTAGSRSLREGEPRADRPGGDRRGDRRRSGRVPRLGRAAFRAVRLGRGDFGARGIRLRSASRRAPRRDGSRVPRDPVRRCSVRAGPGTFSSSRSSTGSSRTASIRRCCSPSRSRPSPRGGESP